MNPRDCQLILDALREMRRQFDERAAKWEQRFSDLGRSCKLVAAQEQRDSVAGLRVGNPESYLAAHFDAPVAADNWGGLFEGDGDCIAAGTGAPVVADNWGGLFDEVPGFRPAPDATSSASSVALDPICTTTIASTGEPGPDTTSSAKEAIVAMHAPSTLAPMQAQAGGYNVDLSAINRFGSTQIHDKDILTWSVPDALPNVTHQEPASPPPTTSCRPAPSPPPDDIMRACGVPASESPALATSATTVLDDVPITQLAHKLEFAQTIQTQPVAPQASEHSRLLAAPTEKERRAPVVRANGLDVSSHINVGISLKLVLLPLHLPSRARPPPTFINCTLRAAPLGGYDSSLDDDPESGIAHFDFDAPLDRAVGRVGQAPATLQADVVGAACGGLLAGMMAAGLPPTKCSMQVHNNTYCSSLLLTLPVAPASSALMTMDPFPASIKASMAEDNFSSNIIDNQGMARPKLLIVVFVDVIGPVKHAPVYVLVVANKPVATLLDTRWVLDLVPHKQPWSPHVQCEIHGDGVPMVVCVTLVPSDDDALEVWIFQLQQLRPPSVVLPLRPLPWPSF